MDSLPQMESKSSFFATDADIKNAPAFNLDKLGNEMENLHIECQERMPVDEYSSMVPGEDTKALGCDDMLYFDGVPDVSECTRKGSLNEESASVPVTEVTKDVKSFVSPSKDVILSSGPSPIYVENMYGNIIVKGGIKKVKVRDPDQVAYDCEKKDSNKLLHSFCWDTDVRIKWVEVCKLFGLSVECELAMEERYEYLYEHLASYLSSHKMTRHQFLRKVSQVADVSHLCCL